MLCLARHRKDLLCRSRKQPPGHLGQGKEALGLPLSASTSGGNSPLEMLRALQMLQEVPWTQILSISQRRSLLPARSRDDQTCRRREQAGREKKKSPPEQRAPKVGGGGGWERRWRRQQPTLSQHLDRLDSEVSGQKRKRGFSKVEEEPKKAGQTCKEQIPARCERPRSLERSQRILSKQQPQRINSKKKNHNSQKPAVGVGAQPRSGGCRERVAGRRGECAGRKSAARWVPGATRSEAPPPAGPGARPHRVSDGLPAARRRLLRAPTPPRPSSDPAGSIPFSLNGAPAPLDSLTRVGRLPLL
uniref:Uncharacterized protein n=1 Tax=Rangifer tarandus platyrhynchus TaxID=3082113 RepID=A0ACB0EJ99_RANTA|nr:unnamed protein product [Rangifer tarandus platyrhynchus]